MFSSPGSDEIDHHTLKLLVGVIALSLASTTSLFSENAIGSISAAYHEGGWARDVLVGSLFAIFAFLLAYNGKSRHEMILSKVTAFAALGVALFPCACDGHPAVIPYLHAVSASVMFSCLAVFCFLFSLRAGSKGHPEAHRRRGIYLACGGLMLVAIAVLVFDHVSGGMIRAVIDRLVFYGEFAALAAFGIAWLTASCVLPVLSSPDERFRPFA